MAKKPTYEELENRIKALEKKTKDFSKVEAALKHRLALEKIIMDISSQFINLPVTDIDKGINEAIQTIGEFVDVDRVYVFMYHPNADIMDNTHEWCQKAFPPQISFHRNIPFKAASWLTAQINAGKTVHIPLSDDLPDEAAILRKDNKRQGVKSSLVVPIEYGGKVIGFLGLNSVREPKTWSEDVIGLLKIVGETVANALERKRSEEAIRASEEKYRTILETLEDGYWEVDLSGEFTFVNPAMCRIADRTVDELIGTNGNADADKETRKKMTEVFRRVFETGKGEKFTDFDMTSASGDRRVIEMSVSLMRDEQGNAIGFRGLSRDVTQKKEAEEALRASEERYRMVLEANPDPVIVLDVEAKVEYFNPMFEQIFGWTLDEVKGKWLKGFLPKGKRSEVQSMYQKIVNGENFYGIETQRLNKAGELIPVSISGSAYKDINDNPMGGVITLQDIREKKRMEAQLFNAQKFESIGTLAGGIAHDFNNLLMGIQGNVSLALFDLAPNHPLFEIFKNIEKHIKSGSRLTSQLLGYARKGRYEVKPLSLNKLVRDMADTFARTRKEITVTHDLAKDLMPVEADEGQIEQVFLNILVNSGQAMPKGGKIFIETKNVTHEDIDNPTFQVKPGKYVLTRVTDTGTGMDNETITHIFEPFFTTKEMGRGTGLGLASSYGIIKGHSGYVTVASTPGKGASFNVYLPVTTKQIFEKTIPKESTLPGKETILFVDDEEIVMNIASKIIEKLGYKVIRALDAREALKIYKEQYNRIHLVILDIIMPEMDGGEVFDRIREINPEAKVLLSSGYSIDGHARNILDRGCNGFIQKPFTMNDLSEKIREVMDG